MGDAEVSIPALYGIIDLEKLCIHEQLSFSKETNQYLLYLTLQKVGAYRAQKLIAKLVEQGQLKWDEEEDFEVEQIVDHVYDEEKDLDYYRIKWRGWSTKYNTWEPLENLNCMDLVQEFTRKNYKKDGIGKFVAVKRRFDVDDDDDDEGEGSKKRSRLGDLLRKLNRGSLHGDITPLQLVSASSSPVKGHGTIAKAAGLEACKGMQVRRRVLQPMKYHPNSNNYKKRKTEVAAALKDWERQLNRICTDPAPIIVENVVDFEGPPDNFQYINDYIAGEGVIIPQDPLVGCECDDCVTNKKQCCPSSSGTEFPYYKRKILRVPPRTPIYECNKRCKCGPECSNRVVQFGRNVKIAIFRTSNGRGWGVKTLQKVKKGTFVMEYVGEVISFEEAERRGHIYDAECRTYLMDLDYCQEVIDCPFTVDAGIYGNASHFVNHSCEPNMNVYGVWINTLDLRLPRIALFSNQDIDTGVELTFDYNMTGDTTQFMTADGVLSQTTTDHTEGSVMAQEVTLSAENPDIIGDHCNPKPVISDRGTAQSPVSNLADTDNSDVSNNTNFNVPSANPNNITNPLSVQIDQNNAINVHTAGSLTPPESLRSENTSLSPTKQPSESAATAPSTASDRQLAMFSASNFKVVCQCGSKNCRKYLF